MQDKKWRRINPYTCEKCGKKRYSFVFSRAKEKICQLCKKHQVPENQPSLFGSQKAIELNNKTVGIIFKKAIKKLKENNQIYETKDNT